MLKQKYFVYILRTSSNTLYIGQTNNLQRRLSEHRKKMVGSANYLKYFSSFNLVYFEIYNLRIEAMRREYQLKHWTKVKKEALINSTKKLAQGEFS
jgi:putative endonuclease